MSRDHSPRLTLSTVNLAVDAATVTPGLNASPCEVDAPTALAALHALAGLPAVALVDVDTKFYLTGPLGKIGVQNISGKLFAAPVPEALNPAAERTPEEALAMVLDPHGETSASGAPLSSSEGEILDDSFRRQHGWKTALNSGWTLAALLVAVLVTAYFTFESTTPDGVDIVLDPAKISAFHARFNGRYGAPPGTVLALADGKLTGLGGGAGTPEEPRFAFTYRYALRGDQVVLVLSNGALLELQGNDRLTFLQSTYPRLPK